MIYSSYLSVTAHAVVGEDLSLNAEEIPEIH